MIRRLATLVVLAAGAARAQAPVKPDTARLTLQASLARAEREATPVLLSQDSLKVSGARVLESYGRFLPAAAAGGGALLAQGTTLLSSTALEASDARWRSASLQLSTALNLFNGFRDQAALHAATLGRDAATFSLTRARQIVVFDALQSFLQVVLDRRLAEVSRANLRLSTTRQSQFEEQVRIGTRAPPDLYRQRAQSATDEAAVIDADTRVEADLLALVRRLRLEPAQTLTVEEPALDTTLVPEDSLALDALLARARRDRGDLAAAIARTAAADEGVKEARSLFLPRVVVGADFIAAGRVYDWERQHGVSTLGTVDQRPLDSQLGRQGLGVYSIGVSVPLFDRYESQAQIEQAKAVAHQSALAAEDLRIRIESDVRQARDEYVAAIARSRAAAANVEAAEEAYTAVSGRFDVGLATFVDVIGAQSALTYARAQREQSTVNLALSKSVLRFVTGAPLQP
ncbi:MAG: TolC family protein [Gemmatimonadetes bacterium]|nr:TolC family protein [Gemmatimonadota bacterium]